MKRIIFVILLLGVALRFYGINWDQGLHLHPDERQLIMVANNIHFFDQLNPQFFNYGSLPIYLLKGVSQLDDFLFNTHLANYDSMLYVGRVLSIVFDLGTLWVVYQIAKLLFKNTTAGLFAAFLYAIAFFPIQNSHFFVVDVFLTFFITSLLYSLMLYLEKPTLQKILFIGIFFAAALATKITAVIFLPIILAVIFLTPDKKRKTFLEKLYPLLAFSGIVLGFHFIFMPYAYLDFLRFIQDTMLQTRMSKDAYIFPYTLQYVYTFPYIYYLKNIFFWGLGPVISILSLIGIGFFLKETKKIPPVFWLFGAFYLFYFLIIGKSAVKFMRYMLPLYPFFVISAGYGLYILKKESRLVLGAFLVLAIVWTACFMQIYSVKHTRIAATQWILQNIQPGSSIAIEHWDDPLPLVGFQNYNMKTLPLYDLPDDDQKWSQIKTTLQSSDYLVIASNRLYTPLQKLSDCKKYTKCYPITAQYYKDLFSGKLGFKKVAEFADSPKVPFLPIYFSDQSADESFTVYDHPTIMIFRKTLRSLSTL